MYLSWVQFGVDAAFMWVLFVFGCFKLGFMLMLCGLCVDFTWFLVWFVLVSIWVLCRFYVGFTFLGGGGLFWSDVGFIWSLFGVLCGFYFGFPFRWALCWVLFGFGLASISFLCGF